MVKFTELYKQAIALWPAEVDVSDGFARGKEGLFFPQLTAVNDEIEQLVPADNYWLVLVSWCMFQAFHVASRNIRESGGSVLVPASVSPEGIEKRVSDNLKIKEWADYKHDYENDLTI